jgi:hypothetical protein
MGAGIQRAVVQTAFDERRRTPTVPRVRDWITDLRLRGGDFSQDAATIAGRVAQQAYQSSGSEDVAFQAARVAYFEALRET